MAKFGKRSIDCLAECDERLQRVMNLAIKQIDFSVICGHRGELAQNTAYAEGKSKLKWPKSKHNKVPSLACDCVPYPVDWDDTKRFVLLSTVIKCVARQIHVDIVWGGDWRWKDYPHWELSE